MTRKEKLLADIAEFHRKFRTEDQNREATAEELAECRRIIREKREVRLTHGEELRAIHQNGFQ